MNKSAPLVMSRAERVIAFVETYCGVPDGKLVGKQLRLDDFQLKFIRDVYDNPHGTRRAYLSMARKNGKTALIAALLLAHVVGPEARLNSEIVSGAMSRDQAAIIFDLACKMVSLSPDLRKLTRITPSSKIIVGLARNVTFKALSAEGKTAHGKSPALVLLDEMGQVRGSRSDFVDAIITAQGAHEDPLLIAISTQAPNDGDMFSIWLDDAATGADPHTVVHLHAASPEAALTDAAAWLAANPAIGRFRSQADVAENAQRAERMPSYEPTFRNLFLNQRVDMVAPFVSRNVWQANSREPNPLAFERGAVYAGLDLSGKCDLTAMVLVADFEDKLHVRCIAWTPAVGLAERARRDRAPYDTWAAQGLLRTVPGASIDYSVLARDILDELEAVSDLRALSFDRWRIDLLKREFELLGAAELPWLAFGQGFKDMAPALDTVETRLMNEQLAHGADPVLTMCMANARVEKDAAGNRKLNKAKATGRIDAAVALVMAVGAMAHSAEPEKSFQSFFV